MTRNPINLKLEPIRVEKETKKKHKLIRSKTNKKKT
jgi:hypothetical protein